MKYQGAEAEAFVLDGAASLNEERGPRLVAHEGGYLDAEARLGLSPYIGKMMRVIIVLILALFLIGNASVALTTSTVALLRQNAKTSSEISEYTAINDDLRIEYSLLTGSERIARIATQKLGMSYANDAGRISLQ